jgi:hypothetical protein
MAYLGTPTGYRPLSQKHDVGVRRDYDYIRGASTPQPLFWDYPIRFSLDESRYSQAQLPVAKFCWLG